MRHFEFQQQLSKTDIIEYNYFVLRFNKWITFNMRFIGLLCIMAGIYLICKEPTNFLYPILIIILGAVSIFAIMPVYKILTKRKILRRKIELPVINVTIGEKGIIYEFVNSTKSETTTNENQIISWEMINRAILENGYLYVLCANTYILVIKQNACDKFIQLEELFIAKLGLNIRYFNKKNHFFLNKKS